jgi:hypothetical protein
MEEMIQVVVSIRKIACTSSSKNKNKWVRGIVEMQAV